IGKFKSETNLSVGAQIAGLFSVALGVLSGVLNSFLMFIVMMGQNIGGLISGSGRSGLLATRLKKYPRESAATDTIFSPFATAFGALFGGLIISALGYPAIFIGLGLLILVFGLAGRKISVQRH
ncbi:MAG: hypothetical protein PHG23_01595, partial [Candidatus Pacebacteria bacterium]|nr:hypothetical protein [Candidatus Paceibacterota bacterium]